ncbi:MAG TPA: hypothetical protein VHI93_07220 [Candidatus Thermoplasmatota archaeon]|nr:hypothetical protein [Candidatus Thermoplasmatota archaeon]
MGLPGQAAPSEWDHAAARLWGLAAQSAVKGKLLAPADAEARLAHPDVDALDQACAAMQAWCWVRGMPPLDRAIAHPRQQGPVRVVADYDVFFEAMGRSVQTERFVLAYPWQKVREPMPRELAWARSLLATEAALLRGFRFLDLELDLREQDSARGRTRPAPGLHAAWADAAERHRALANELAVAGVALADVRPPGSAPYPPPVPREAAWEH